MSIRRRIAVLATSALVALVVVLGTGVAKIPRWVSSVLFAVNAPLTGTTLSSAAFYSKYASEFTGDWFFVNGDGTTAPGSGTVTAVGSPAANSVLDAAATEQSTTFLNGTSQYFYGPTFSNSGAFSVGVTFTYDAATAGNQQLISSWWTPGVYFLVYLNSSGQVVANYGGAGTIGASGASFVPPRAVNTVVVTYDPVGAGASRLILYVNGVQVAQTGTINVYSTTNNRWSVGAKEDTSPNEFLKGNIVSAWYTEKVLTVETVSRMAADHGYRLPSTSDGWVAAFARATPAAFNPPGTAKVGWVPAGWPRLSSANGYLNEPAATNLLLRSDDGSAAAWQSVTTGAPVTRTANYAFAPDGSKTATRLEIPAVNSGDRIGVLQQAPSGSLTDGASYTWSFWARATSGTATLPIFTTNASAHANFQQVSLTEAWQRVTVTYAISTTTQYVYFGNDRETAVTPSTNGVDSAAADVLIWGAQYERGPTATSNIITAASTVTRNADALTWGTNSNQVLFNSEGSTALWTSSNMTSTANTGETAAPDGTFTATKHTPTGAGNVEHYTSQDPSATLTANRIYWNSVYLKALAGRYVHLCRGPSVYTALVVDLQTGSYQVGPDWNHTGVRRAPFNVSVTDAGNGWWRVGWASMAGGSTAASDAFRISSWNSPTPATPAGGPTYIQAGETFYSWGANITARSSETNDSPIPYLRTPPVTAINGSPDLAYGQTRARRFRRNWVLQSEALGTAPWTIATTGSATLTATNNTAEVTDPFGGNKATKLAFSDIANPATATISQTGMGENVNSIYRASIWLRTEAGTSATLYAICTSSNAQWRSLAITDTWQRFDWLMARSTPLSFIIGIKPGVSSMGSLASPTTVYAYGAQMTDGAELVTPTSFYVPTTTEVSDEFALKGELRISAGYAKNTIGGSTTYGHALFAGRSASDYWGSGGVPPSDTFALFAAMNGGLGAPDVAATPPTAGFVALKWLWDWRTGTSQAFAGGAGGTIQTDYTATGFATIDTYRIGDRPNVVTPWSGYIKDIKLRKRE